MFTAGGKLQRRLRDDAPADICASTRGRQKGPDPGFCLLKVRFSCWGQALSDVELVLRSDRSAALQQTLVWSVVYS